MPPRKAATHKDLSNVPSADLITEIARRVSEDLSLLDTLRAALPKLHEFPVIIPEVQPIGSGTATIASEKGILWLAILMTALHWRASLEKDGGVYAWFVRTRDAIYGQAKAGAIRVSDIPKNELPLPEGSSPEEQEKWRVFRAQSLRSLKAMHSLRALLLAAMHTPAFQTVKDLRGAHPKGTKRKARLTPAEICALYDSLLHSYRKTTTGRVKPETQAMRAVGAAADIGVRQVSTYLKRK